MQDKYVTTVFIAAIIGILITVFLVGNCQNTDLKLRNEFNKTMFEQGYEMSYAPGTNYQVWTKKK